MQPRALCCCGRRGAAVLGSTSSTLLQHITDVVCGVHGCASLSGGRPGAAAPAAGGSADEGADSARATLQHAGGRGQNSSAGCSRHAPGSPTPATSRASLCGASAVSGAGSGAFAQQQRHVHSSEPTAQPPPMSEPQLAESQLQELGASSEYLALGLASSSSGGSSHGAGGSTGAGLRGFGAGEEQPSLAALARQLRAKQLRPPRRAVPAPLQEEHGGNPAAAAAAVDGGLQSQVSALKARLSQLQAGPSVAGPPPHWQLRAPDSAAAASPSGFKMAVRQRQQPGADPAAAAGPAGPAAPADGSSGAALQPAQPQAPAARAGAQQDVQAHRPQQRSRRVRALLTGVKQAPVQAGQQALPSSNWQAVSQLLQERYMRQQEQVQQWQQQRQQERQQEALSPSVAPATERHVSEAQQPELVLQLQPQVHQQQQQQQLHQQQQQQQQLHQEQHAAAAIAGAQHNKLQAMLDVLLPRPVDSSSSGGGGSSSGSAGPATAPEHSASVVHELAMLQAQEQQQQLLRQELLSRLQAAAAQAAAPAPAPAREQVSDSSVYASLDGVLAHIMQALGSSSTAAPTANGLELSLGGSTHAEQRRRAQLVLLQQRLQQLEQQPLTQPPASEPGLHAAALAGLRDVVTSLAASADGSSAAAGLPASSGLASSNSSSSSGELLQLLQHAHEQQAQHASQQHQPRGPSLQALMQQLTQQSVPRPHVEAAAGLQGLGDVVERLYPSSSSSSSSTSQQPEAAAVLPSPAAEPAMPPSGAAATASVAERQGSLPDLELLLQQAADLAQPGPAAAGQSAAVEAALAHLRQLLSPGGASSSGSSRSSPSEAWGAPAQPAALAAWQQAVQPARVDLESLLEQLGGSAHVTGSSSSSSGLAQQQQGGDQGLKALLDDLSSSLSTGSADVIAANHALAAVLSGAWQPLPEQQPLEPQLADASRSAAVKADARQQQQLRQQQQQLPEAAAETLPSMPEADASSMAAATEARMQQLLAVLAEADDSSVIATGSSKGKKQARSAAQDAAADSARRRKARERERAAGLAAAAAAKAEKAAARKTAATTAGAAAGSRWASRLQQLQQVTAAASDADAVGAAEDAEADAEAAAEELAHASDTAASSDGRQLQEVQMPAQCSVRQLAGLLGAELGQLEAVLRDQLGEELASDEDLVAPEAAELAALEFGCVLLRPPEDPAVAASATPRPPVVTVMGHVDHGKTSLLDALRSSNLTAGEAGGITQHIGAFEVRLPGSGAALTFLDTPGHAAFGAMRARGAAATDIVVLAVAADDGVMPQTREALAHARAAGVPVVVALTKCDLPQARPEHVKMQLLAEGLELEEFGGDVQCVETAAKSGAGLQALEDALLLQAEVMELAAPCAVPAAGVVVEAQLSRGLGPVATVIVRRGTLRPGDSLVVGTEHGRVRALRDGAGSSLDAAGPGRAVLVSGLRGLPAAGDELLVVASEARAAKMAAARSVRAEGFRLAQLARMQAEARRQQAAARELEYERKRALRQRIMAIKAGGYKSANTAQLKSMLAESLGLEEAQLKAAAAAAAGRPLPAGGAVGDEPQPQHAPEPGQGSGDAPAPAELPAELPAGAPALPLLVKADVQGTVEAVTAALAGAAAGRVALRVVYSGVGPITASDVHLAAATGARIVAFGLRPPGGDVEASLRGARVEVLSHRVIYHLLDQVEGLIAAAEAGGDAGPGGQAEEVLGSGLVLQVFPLLRNRREAGKVAGCRVQDGSLSAAPGLLFRVLRDGAVVHEGPCSSLRQQRADVAAVGKGGECGVVLDDGGWCDWQPGDVVQCVQRRTTRA